jgi:hypothetical protein
MAEAERLLRRALIRILQSADLTKAFSGKGRECFLDDLVFKSGAANTPLQPPEKSAAAERQIVMRL